MTTFTGDPEGVPLSGQCVVPEARHPEAGSVTQYALRVETVPGLPDAIRFQLDEWGYATGDIVIGRGSAHVVWEWLSIWLGMPR